MITYRTPLLPAIFLAVTTCSSYAQDPAKTDANIYRCTLENERIRLCEVTFKPGARIVMHWHPDRVVYSVGGGTLTVTGEDGKARDFTYQPGQSFFFTASSHSAVNNGNVEVKLVMVELKTAGKK